MNPAFLNQRFIPHLHRVTVCKLAGYLENDSGHELPKQLNPCELLSRFPVLLAIQAEMLCLFRTLIL